jgi:hypothetical protein
VLTSSQKFDAVCACVLPALLLVSLRCTVATSSRRFLPLSVYLDRSSSLWISLSLAPITHTPHALLGTHGVLKVSHFAAADLEKYQQALERALMHFHSMKMSEINKIIKELWQTVYQGRDIDTIEIRAEAATSKARSYNYRVVMLKHGIELDMRGRCSAGQKVSS